MNWPTTLRTMTLLIAFRKRLDHSVVTVVWEGEEKHITQCIIGTNHPVYYENRLNSTAVIAELTHIIRTINELFANFIVCSWLVNIQPATYKLSVLKTIFEFIKIKRRINIRINLQMHSYKESNICSVLENLCVNTVLIKQQIKLSTGWP